MEVERRRHAIAGAPLALGAVEFARSEVEVSRGRTIFATSCHKILNILYLYATF